MTTIKSLVKTKPQWKICVSGFPAKPDPKHGTLHADVSSARVFVQQLRSDSKTHELFRIRLRNEKVYISPRLYDNKVKFSWDLQAVTSTCKRLGLIVKKLTSRNKPMYSDD